MDEDAAWIGDEGDRGLARVRANSQFALKTKGVAARSKRAKGVVTVEQCEPEGLD